MTFEIVLLALASTIRPTSLAAVYTLLREPSPRRLLAVYAAAGLAFTISFGLIVVGAVHGIEVTHGSHTKGIAEVIGGVLALLFGFGLLAGRFGRRGAGDAPKIASGWEERLARHVTFRTAVLAGPATHIPGIFYLVALNVIVARQPPLVTSVFQLLLFNGVWFLLPLGALVLCIIDPPRARTAVQAIRDWAELHSRGLLLLIAFGLGIALLVSGLTIL